MNKIDFVVNFDFDTGEILITLPDNTYYSHKTAEGARLAKRFNALIDKAIAAYENEQASRIMPDDIN